MPSVVNWPLGNKVEAFSAEGALNGPVPRSPGLVQRAAGWRDGGGTLALDRVVVHWGALDLTGTATLALDDQLQPMGSGNARIRGYADALDSLAAHGTMSRRASTAAKAVLALIARSENEPGVPEVESP